jgi:hypothetical protein
MAGAQQHSDCFTIAPLAGFDPIKNSAILDLSQMPSAHLLLGVSRPWESHTEQRFPGPNFHEGAKTALVHARPATKQNLRLAKFHRGRS